MVDQEIGKGARLDRREREEPGIGTVVGIVVGKIAIDIGATHRVFVIARVAVVILSLDADEAILADLTLGRVGAPQQPRLQ